MAHDKNKEGKSKGGQGRAPHAQLIRGMWMWRTEVQSFDKRRVILLDYVDVILPCFLAAPQSIYHYHFSN